MNSEHESLIQVEAVIYAGEPLPNISLGQSINIPGSEIILFDSTDLYLDEAEVSLLWNNQSIEVEQIALGVYQPISDDIVAKGDTFDIEVQHNGRIAKARAIVPNHDLENLIISVPDTIAISELYLQKFSYEYDTLEDGYVYEVSTPYDSSIWADFISVNLEIPFVPDYAVIRSYSSHQEKLGPYSHSIRHDEWWSWQNRSGIYYSYSGTDYFGFDQLSIGLNNLCFVDEEIHFQNGNLPYDLEVEIVIPEKIYADYLELNDDGLVPMTITNVENGIGLFIGALQWRNTLNLTLPIKKGEYQEPNLH